MRPRRPDHPLRTGFRGTPAYPPTPRWVLDGRCVPFDVSRPTTVGAAVEGLAHGPAAPDAQGRVTLDFHRAPNLPCAYTDFATCPLPPVENRLPVAVEAGEKLPYERHASAGQP
ncbi:Protein of unknown function (DUF1684) [Micromonospora matsumotoense]|uniref:DUF1684 domain-containing protein n=1 Tax=Micromonospora matsumotoense TaxID=121616 RepID=A0A1C4V7I0_9ACTN|nr:DUF1684 domain-containing protein [Micromonospora matsumotoense]SCE79973.1 Protein of unknown function (DUF1684) [Micromonospora matsumotoense]